METAGLEAELYIAQAQIKELQAKLDEAEDEPRTSSGVKAIWDEFFGGSRK